MTVDRGGENHSGEQNKWLVDSVGQYISGLNFGTGISSTVTLSSGYRFPVQIPVITNILFCAKSNSVNFAWDGDVDYVWLSETNKFQPDGLDFANSSEDLNLLKSAVENFSDYNHRNWEQRFYQVAFEDEFAEEIVGKISSQLLVGWNFLSIPFDPMTNQLGFLLDGQINAGKEISAPLADVVYAKALDSDMVLPHFYVNSTTGSNWHVLEKTSLDLKRGFYIRVQENSDAKQVVFAGYVPKVPKNMGEIAPGWNLVAQPYPVSVSLENSDLWESGLEPGTLTRNGHSGDAVFTQKDIDKKVLLGTFLQENLQGQNPEWIGPMDSYLSPGKGYWVFVQPDHPGIQNWFYPLPYYITPIEF